MFLLAGSPELLNLNFRAGQVLWWDAALSIAFFLQHSGMVRKSIRQRLAHFFPEEYQGAL
ncbi:MAG TPA: hypothetical protein VK568_04090 [Thermodesulfobacteriota bacterium]|nr:hypothetical protein [Thermodesulfobacteriota bacterium]